MQNELYIIGNGFDLHHGLKTNYYNFSEYLKEKDKELYEMLESYILYPQSDENLWAKFEENLANLDADEILSENSDYLPNIMSDDFRDRDLHTFPDVMYRFCERLTKGLLNHFKEFIKSVEYPESVYTKKIRLDKNSKFLTFNYTNTLEKLYKVEEKNILYIHNSVNRHDNIILGHGIDPKKFEKKNPEPPDNLSDEELYIWHQENDDYDYSFDTGRENLYNFFKIMYKPTANIIASNKAFFKNLKNIEKVYVYGHSISEVDIPYFQELVKSVNDSTEWYVSYYGDDGKEALRKSLLKLDIKENKITFITLEDIQQNKTQLKFNF